MINMGLIEDKYGRKFRTLRVSLLHHCNLGCVYCVAGDDDALKTHNANVSAIGSHARKGQAAAGSALSVPNLLTIIERLHGQLGLHTIRLTGGEPLLYTGITGLIAGIKEIGIPEIKLTTNGFLLERLAAPLKEAGMGSINVSLDAVDEEVFFRMSRRRGVGRIVRGIDAARQTGLSVKINTVVMRGMNDSQILPLLDIAFARGLQIRFLEVMAMGHLYGTSGKYLFSQKDILSVIATRHRFIPLGRTGSATASYWQTEDGHSFGIIANESEPFCQDCDRLRLDSEGNIYGCLSSNHPIPLGTKETELEWHSKLEQALLQKQALRFTGSDLSMLHIGG
jgi:cyclic pyranopterin phosphate synthase